MLAIYVFIFASLLYLLYTRLTSPISKLPGPFLTSLTSIPLKYHEFTGTRRTWIHSLHLKYGPAVRLAPNEASFSSLAALKEIYTSQGAGYDRTEFYDLFKQFGTRTLFSTPPKSPHGARKKIFADRYANTNIMRPETLSALQNRAGVFLQNCLNSNKADPDVYVQLHCFALDGATHFLFAPNGTNSLENDDDFKMMEEQTYHESLADNWLAYYSPWLSDLLADWGIRESRPSPLANAYVLENAGKDGASEISLIAKLRAKKADMEELSPAAECMDHLAAGIDTTGDGLCFLMHQLSLPESRHVQEKLHQELVEKEEMPFDQLPYLDAVIREGLRCFPPIPMSFPRYVPEGGRRLEGYYLPAKTIVSCQPWTIHKDPLIFPEPETFKPERWLEEDGKLERERMFFAFSQGSRGCIGKK